MWIVGMPNLGHTMETGKLLEWLKRRGETVKAGDPVALVESDKVTIEIEAPGDGVLLEIAVEAEAIVPVGGVLAVIGRSDEAEAARRKIADANSASESQSPAKTTTVAPVAAPAPSRTTGQTPSQSGVTSRPGRFAASPAAKRLAAECGIDLADVTTEAPDGIITRADVERAVAAGRRAAAVVMLHGFGGDASLWDLVGAALPVGRPALSPLLPGHGGPALSDDASVEALAEALAAEPPFRGTEELHLVGHSLGAAVAILLAGRLGPRVLSLTLIAPLGFGRQIDGGFLADYLAGADEERARAALARLVGTSGRVSPALLSRTVAQMRGPSAAGLQRIAAAAFPSGRSLFDGLGALARVLAPVQTIWGREDAVIPPSDIWSMPDGVDLHLLAGAGHLVPAERAACVAALIESFATRHATGVKS